MKELLDKWIKTTKFIEHSEVRQLMKYYEGLLSALSFCPEVYLLVKYDARKQLDKLKDIDQAFKEQTK